MGNEKGYLMADNNKTMLVPMENSATDKLTDFQAPAQDYNAFAEASATQTFKVNMDNYHNSDNPLLATSSVLLKKMYVLQHTYDIGNVNEVRQDLVDMMNLVMESFTKQNIESNQMLLARYLLCTFMDEIISSTYWGKEHNWASNSLLGIFYNETYGGDKFFQLLSQLQASAATHINLLELMYIALSLGFEGKYRIQPRGKMDLDTIRENLFKQIKMVKGQSALKFYNEQEATKVSDRFLYKASHKMVYVSIAVMFVIIYTVLTISLVSKEGDLMDVMERQYTAYATEHGTVKDGIDNEEGIE